MKKTKEKYLVLNLAGQTRQILKVSSGDNTNRRKYQREKNKDEEKNRKPNRINPFSKKVRTTLESLKNFV